MSLVVDNPQQYKPICNSSYLSFSEDEWHDILLLLIKKKPELVSLFKDNSIQLPSKIIVNTGRNCIFRGNDSKMPCSLRSLLQHELILCQNPPKV